MDVHDSRTRSYNMSRIKCRDTAPEIRVRKWLHGMGYRYRLCPTDLPGKPDIVLKKLRTVIFIDGCFWHGHTGCKYFTLPKTRTIWWKNKIERTKQLDGKHRTQLRKAGWKVITIFECELRNDSYMYTFERLTDELH